MAERDIVEEYRHELDLSADASVAHVDLDTRAALDAIAS
jgi:hypothetical protein